MINTRPNCLSASVNINDFLKNFILGLREIHFRLIEYYIITNITQFFASPSIQGMFLISSVNPFF